jgi:hypothetical protein
MAVDETVFSLTDDHRKDRLSRDAAFVANLMPTANRSIIACSLSRPCDYGGMRWWRICLPSDRRAAKLYLPPGATVLAAWQPYWLRWRLYSKLGGESPPARPKGMSRKMYERLTEDLDAAMEAHERAFMARFPRSSHGRKKPAAEGDRCAI